MKKILMLFAAIMIVVGITNRGYAQLTVNNNTAGAELVKAITLTNTTPLHFGVIAIPATASTVKLTTGGARSILTGTATKVLTGTASNPALFTVTGTAEDNYTLTLPTSINVITDGGGGEGLIKEMIIDNILVNVNATGEATYSGPINTPTLNSSGNSTFLVGGTLNIKALQTLGVYAGNYSVTVDYY